MCIKDPISAEKMVKICQNGTSKIKPNNAFFPVFAKNFRKPWMKLNIFFCQFPNPWTLRVSGMGCYTSKCEKSQNHCTLTPIHRPVHWYHSRADIIWLVPPFKARTRSSSPLWDGEVMMFFTLYKYWPVLTRSRIHERTILLRFLGIILRVLRLEASVYNVYITNQFQTAVSTGDCE